MLAEDRVVHILLERGLIQPEAILSGRLRIQDRSSRNRNFAVHVGPRQGFLIKQGLPTQGSSTIAHEAATYRLLHETLDPTAARFLPRFHGYLEEYDLLILELVPDSWHLDAYHARAGRVPLRLARYAAEATAAIHGVRPTCTRKPEAWYRDSHWILSLGTPDCDLMVTASAGELELVRILQQFPDFCDALGKERDEWRSECLIHADLKSSNFILPRTLTGGVPRIVDWELASWGDPRWDVGSVFADYLALWLLSVPVTGDTPPERFLDLTRFPLENVWPATRSFWRTYARCRGMSEGMRGAFLLGSVRHAAARLVQTAFEIMQHSQQLTGNAVCLLQVSWNMLRRPDQAATQLLGLDGSVPS